MGTSNAIMISTNLSVPCMDPKRLSRKLDILSILYFFYFSIMQSTKNTKEDFNIAYRLYMKKLTMLKAKKKNLLISGWLFYYPFQRVFSCSRKHIFINTLVSLTEWKLLMNIQITLRNTAEAEKKETTNQIHKLYTIPSILALYLATWYPLCKRVT